MSETLSQVYNALYQFMGSDLREWVEREHPSAQQMRDKLRQLKEERSNRDRGVLHLVTTGMIDRS
jgi:hypothetical protein